MMMRVFYIDKKLKKECKPTVKIIIKTYCQAMILLILSTYFSNNINMEIKYSDFGEAFFIVHIEKRYL